MIKESFTAASTTPIKIIADGVLIRNIQNNNIQPKHIQINPTNKCPFNCSFCSCKNRNKTLELEYGKLKNLIITYRYLGTEACTITGGGDPLAYPHINDLIIECDNLGIETSLVTNGILFNKLNRDALEKLTWCRISISEETTLDFDFLQKIIYSVNHNPPDWSFSYVVTINPKIDILVKGIEFANKNKFTHVRIVDDILETNNDSLERIKKQLKDLNIDDSLVIYQGRKQYTEGNKRCLISLLKPNIGPDGNIYPCCGIQYSQNPPSLDFDEKLSMGNDPRSIYYNQKYYDGSVCDKCYYSEYNDILCKIQDHYLIKHKKFI